MYERILLPLSGSTVAAQALPHAIGQAKRFQAELIVLHVLESSPESLATWRPYYTVIKTSSTALMRQYLENIAADAREHVPRVRVAMLEGNPHTLIAAYAVKARVDLIVMGVRRRTGLSRWFASSVSASVMRTSRVPVLLVRAENDGRQWASIAAETSEILPSLQAWPKNRSSARTRVRDGR